MTEHNNNYSHLPSNNLVRSTVALVLAGGKGTRLKGLTKEIAKPAVSFGGKYKIIDFTLSNCVNSGIRRVGVLTQFMAHDLIDHLQKGWNFMTNSALNEGVSIIPAQQRTGEAWYRGTADAVYQNLDIIRKQKAQQVLILGGDHIYKMDYSRMLNFHAENGADVTVACIKKPLEQASSFGVMSLNENGQIVQFDEKPENPRPHPKDPSQALVSMGIYIFNTDVLDKELCDALNDPNYNHDFGHNIIPNLLERYNVSGYVFTEKGHPGHNAYWRDVGNLDEYYAANMDLLAPTPELDLYDHSWPTITQQQQRPGAKFIFNDEGRRGSAVDSVLSAGTIISGAEVEHSLVSYNCRIEEGSKVQDSILLPDVLVGKDCRLTKVIVGEGTIIPDGTIIGEDPVKDAEMYEVTEGGVVLVTEENFR
ncbi:glucose-1-phosphate adenylyltransferase [Vibrio ishigakensis]|uniref:Glucose-1-phosphate adenylyltransferase n=1 Tax=Vibrio ishigakensis TaxID=1481914 RepID=A0A0B8QP07_9VIBR|nr:glucose-1-phosphate adenylyltransferase [Vibrio ishigakensis]GAM58296.1 glucose-1-phosphate adenylyltransferase [Vibrio ishigakensis]GAM76758.1 glucose-1-phosphate adenylyltransferase [Vibrio ishigakensis]